jgi:hypothetical protein
MQRNDAEARLLELSLRHQDRLRRDLLPAISSRHLPFRTRYLGDKSDARDARLANELVSSVALGASEINPRQLAREFRIESASIENLRWGETRVFAKINHGFWEKLFVAVSTRSKLLPIRPELKASGPRFQKLLLYSGFLGSFSASLALAREAGLFEAGGAAFGISFNNGDFWQTEWTQIWPRSARDAAVTRGSYAGLKLVHALFPESMPSIFADGAEPKKLLLNGTLRPKIEQLRENSDRTIFFVPPHLGGVSLKEPGSTKQEVHIWHPTEAAASWQEIVKGPADRVLNLLKSGNRVLVLAQGGPAAAFLGIYLAWAANYHDYVGELIFIDCGQALDSADPSPSNGFWLKKLPPAEQRRIHNLSPFKIC